MIDEDTNFIDLLDDDQDDQYEKQSTLNNDDIELKLANNYDTDTVAEIHSVKVDDVDVDERTIVSLGYAYNTSLSNNVSVYYFIFCWFCT